MIDSTVIDYLDDYPSNFHMVPLKSMINPISTWEISWHAFFLTSQEETDD